MGAVNIKGIVTPLVPNGTPSPLRLASPQQLRAQATGLPSGVASSLAADLDQVNRVVNQLHTNQQQSPAVSRLFLTNEAGDVIAAFGLTTYEGVPYTNYLSELHVGDPLKTHNPAEALLNADHNGTVSIGQSGAIDVHDPFEGNAAWIGTQYDGTVIVNAGDSGTGLIRLTVPGHTLVTNSVSTVRNMNLWNVPNANGTWTVTRIDASTIDLQGSIWSGPFGYVDDDGDVDPVPESLPAGIPTFLPTIDRVLSIAAITDNAGTMHVTTAVAHGYETATRINIPAPGPNGLPALVGQWLAYVDPAFPAEFDLYKDADPIPTPVPYAAGYVSGGTVVAYFPGMLADSFAVGPSFQDYRLRAFPNGDLRINNAQIQLTTGPDSVKLDPSIPAIVLSSPAGKIELNATTEQITMTSAVSQITMDAVTGRITIGALPNQIILDAVTGRITIGTLPNQIILDAAPGQIALGPLANQILMNASNGLITMGVAANQIQLNATTGHVTLISPNSSILLDAATGQITVSDLAGGSLAKIIIDATAPAISMYDAFGVLSASLAADGTFQARTVSSTSGFSGTATVQNAAGTGTSDLVFTNGICTSYTP